MESIPSTLAFIFALSALGTVQCGLFDLTLQLTKHLAGGVQKAVDDSANLFFTPDKKCEYLPCSKIDYEIIKNDRDQLDNSLKGAQPSNRPVQPMGQGNGQQPSYPWQRGGQTGAQQGYFGGQKRPQQGQIGPHITSGHEQPQPDRQKVAIIY